MSKSDRNEAKREETERSSRRSGVLRRGRRKSEAEAVSRPRDEAAAARDQPGSQSKPPPKPATTNATSPEPAGGKPHPGKTGEGSLEDEGDVSSLLETTGEDVKRLLRAADDASKKIREAARAEASGPGSEGAKGDAEGASLVGRINREVEKVLETADEAADKIRDEARGEARQVIEEARRRAEAVTKQQIDRVSEMTEQVMGELSAVQDRLDRLRAAYEQAMRTMNADLGEQESVVWDMRRNGDVEDDDEPDPLRARLGKRTLRKGAQEPQEISEGARLLALQQMMAGVDPQVIERRLRTEFGIEDPKPILDWMGLHGAGPAKARDPKQR